MFDSYTTNFMRDEKTQGLCLHVCLYVRMYVGQYLSLPWTLLRYNQMAVDVEHTHLYLLHSSHSFLFFSFFGFNIADQNSQTDNHRCGRGRKNEVPEHARIYLNLTVKKKKQQANIPSFSRTHDRKLAYANPDFFILCFSCEDIPSYQNLEVSPRKPLEHHSVHLSPSQDYANCFLMDFSSPFFLL